MTSWAENSLLERLRGEEIELLLPHLKSFDATPDSVIYRPGQHVQTVYFPLGDTLVSFVVSTEDGGSVEIIQVGREGAVGGIVSQGHLPAYSRIMVQAGGRFAAVSTAALDEAKARSRHMENLFSRYADCMLAQVFQSTACNASHTIEQRAAKWIVSTIGRTGSDEIRLTQDRLSAMLGVGRSYVSRVIGRFRGDGLLKVRRGRILVTDLRGLQARACGCNEAVRAHFDTVLKGVYPAGSGEPANADGATLART